jgi:GTP-binding protein
VGKSTLINRILGEERLIASAEPGTTRDAIDTTVETEEGETFTLIDTAGIRRRGKVERGMEKIAVLSSMIAIRRADVAAVVVDGSEGLTAQDAHIASYCVDEGCGCLVAVNKWDLVEKDHRTADQFTKTLTREWGFLQYAPVIYVSARTGQRVRRILEVARRVYACAGRKIGTPELNAKVEQWTRRHPPPTRKNRQLRIKYAAQTGTHPPAFTFFVNDPTLAHFSYRRHLSNRLREEYDFEGTPIRLIFKAKAGRRPPTGGESSGRGEARARRSLRRGGLT